MKQPKYKIGDVVILRSDTFELESNAKYVQGKIIAGEYLPGLKEWEYDIEILTYSEDDEKWRKEVYGGDEHDIIQKIK